jgi:hypothetical protein
MYKQRAAATAVAACVRAAVCEGHDAIQVGRATTEKNGERKRNWEPGDEDELQRSTYSSFRYLLVLL